MFSVRMAIVDVAARLSLESTLLASAVYFAESAVLELEFRDGARYRFYGVPAADFQQLLASDSKGGYFNRSIRNRFPYQRVFAPDHQN